MCFTPGLTIIKPDGPETPHQNHTLFGTIVSIFLDTEVEPSQDSQVDASYPKWVAPRYRGSPSLRSITLHNVFLKPLIKRIRFRPLNQPHHLASRRVLILWKLGKCLKRIYQKYSTGMYYKKLYVGGGIKLWPTNQPTGLLNPLHGA